MHLAAGPVSVPGRGFDYVVMPLAPVLLVLPLNASVGLFDSVMIRRSARQATERLLFLVAGACWVLVVGLLGGLAVTDPDVTPGMLVRNGALAAAPVLLASVAGIHQAASVTVVLYAAVSWVMGTDPIAPPARWAVLFRPTSQTPWAPVLICVGVVAFALGGVLRRLAGNASGRSSLRQWIAPLRPGAETR
jgi:hypothetical protein